MATRVGDSISWPLLSYFSSENFGEDGDKGPFYLEYFYGPDGKMQVQTNGENVAQGFKKAGGNC